MQARLCLFLYNGAQSQRRHIFARRVFRFCLKLFSNRLVAQGGGAGRKLFTSSNSQQAQLGLYHWGTAGRATSVEILSTAAQVREKSYLKLCLIYVLSWRSLLLAFLHGYHQKLTNNGARSEQGTKTSSASAGMTDRAKTNRSEFETVNAPSMGRPIKTATSVFSLTGLWP